MFIGKLKWFYKTTNKVDDKALGATFNSHISEL